MFQKSMNYLIGSAKRFFTLLIILFLACSMLWAQDPEVPGTTLTDLIGLQEFIYGGLVTLLGYLSAKIPGINKIPGTW